MRLDLVEMGAQGLPAARGPAEEIWAPKYPRIKAVMTEMRGPLDMALPSFQVGSKFLPSTLEHEDTLGLQFSRCHCTTLGGAIVQWVQPLGVLWLSVQDTPPFSVSLRVGLSCRAGDLLIALIKFLSTRLGHDSISRLVIY